MLPTTGDRGVRPGGRTRPDDATPPFDRGSSRLTLMDKENSAPRVLLAATHASKLSPFLASAATARAARTRARPRHRPRAAPPRAAGARRRPGLRFDDARVEVVAAGQCLSRVQNAAAPHVLVSRRRSCRRDVGFAKDPGASRCPSSVCLQRVARRARLVLPASTRDAGSARSTRRGTRPRTATARSRAAVSRDFDSAVAELCLKSSRPPSAPPRRMPESARPSPIPKAAPRAARPPRRRARGARGSIAATCRVRTPSPEPWRVFDQRSLPVERLRARRARRASAQLGRRCVAPVARTRRRNRRCRARPSGRPASVRAIQLRRHASGAESRARARAGRWYRMFCFRAEGVAITSRLRPSRAEALVAQMLEAARARAPRGVRAACRAQRHSLGACTRRTLEPCSERLLSASSPCASACGRSGAAAGPASIFKQASDGRAGSNAKGKALRRWTQHARALRSLYDRACSAAGLFWQAAPRWTSSRAPIDEPAAAS